MLQFHERLQVDDVVIDSIQEMLVLKNQFAENIQRNVSITDRRRLSCHLCNDMISQTVERATAQSFNLHTLRQFVGSFLGIGQQKNLFGIDMLLLYQIFSFPHDGRSLSASRTRYHQAVIFQFNYRVTLLRVERIRSKHMVKV